MASSKAGLPPEWALQVRSARKGVQVSQKEECEASGRLSQFQPPSGHCQPRSFFTRDSVPLSTMFYRTEAYTALASWLAQRRVRPSNVRMLLICCSEDNHA